MTRSPQTQNPQAKTANMKNLLLQDPLQQQRSFLPQQKIYTWCQAKRGFIAKQEWEGSSSGAGCCSEWKKEIIGEWKCGYIQHPVPSLFSPIAKPLSFFADSTTTEPAEARKSLVLFIYPLGTFNFYSSATRWVRLYPTYSLAMLHFFPYIHARLYEPINSDIRLCSQPSRPTDRAPYCYWGSKRD